MHFYEVKTETIEYTIFMIPAYFCSYNIISMFLIFLAVFSKYLQQMPKIINAYSIIILSLM